MNDVILIDAGTGNLRSVQKALESIGANVLRTNDPHRVLSGRRVVLPGVGAFGNFMSGLRTLGLEDAVKEAAMNGVPVLGICVGMQAFFEVGEELGEHAGLGLLRGKVVRFEPSTSVKIPHTGWNQIQTKKETLLFKGIHEGHMSISIIHIYCQARDAMDILATTDYGINYACAVERENIFGVQFHPEKSQSAGLRILKNFLGAE